MSLGRCGPFSCLSGGRCRTKIRLRLREGPNLLPARGRLGQAPGRGEQELGHVLAERGPNRERQPAPGHFERLPPERRLGESQVLSGPSVQILACYFIFECSKMTVQDRPRSAQATKSKSAQERGAFLGHDDGLTRAQKLPKAGPVFTAFRRITSCRPGGP